MLPTNYKPTPTTGPELILKSYVYDAALAKISKTPTNLKILF
jgi:hypothetical protein